MKEEKVWFKDSMGHRLCGVLLTPSETGSFPAVITIHGLSSSKDSKSYKHISQMLASRGMATLCIDCYGHGESEGQLTDVTVTTGVNSLIAAINYLSSLPNIDNTKLGVFGSSYGGSVTIAAASRDPRIKVIFFRRPASDYKQIRMLQLGKQGLAEWERKGILLVGGHYNLKWSFYQDILDNHRDQYAEAKKITVPVFIIHGGADDVVPIEQSKNLYTALTGRKKLEILPKEGHIFSSEANSKVDVSLLKWFTKYLK